MSDSSSGSGLGFCGMLAILFIGLKLGGVIEWSWWWVLGPLWIPAAVVLGVVGVTAVVAGAVALFSRLARGIR